MPDNNLQKTGFDLHQRILVVNRGSLLDEGVVSLISSNANLEVSTIKFEGADVLVDDILSRHPEVVVMGQSQNLKFENLYHFLTSIPTLAQLSMIIFHSNDNLVDIFSREQHNSIHSDEFIALVQGIPAI